ncbi:MAG: Sulfur carrier protein adenylyltransferase ThiF [Candidatus Ozemobacter sibiricus]|uniref:Sulfur carrier protein adenylyltransferase ThiF n=1 Tax=Candidatus Ozemobacter sibiricus TaxID=2268124 RepID=A0A367ZQB1_9BACT|nr:MAG: Sulfur carrier protein adenylyltransferase ThiF [Candidatus Ozemobacter sibiricus]
MNIFVNERPVTVEADATVALVATLCKPDADIFLCNGAPVPTTTRLQEGDRLVLIRRGEIPTPEELDVLMAARHTPGVHARLKRATVGIAGCGGLGSTVAVALARVGIGTLILADFDVVEPSNLNRQQFFVDQIGQRKVEALAATLARINPAVRVVPHAVRVVPDNVAALFGPVDVLVEAFDRADQKAMLFETVQREFPDKPLVMGLGMAGWGRNDLLGVRRSGSLSICGDDLAEAGPHAGLMAPRVGVVAHLQANQVMEILLGPDPHIARLEQARR